MITLYPAWEGGHFSNGAVFWTTMYIFNRNLIRKYCFPDFPSHWSGHVPLPRSWQYWTFNHSTVIHLTILRNVGRIFQILFFWTTWELLRQRVANTSAVNFWVERFWLYVILFAEQCSNPWKQASMRAREMFVRGMWIAAPILKNYSQRFCEFLFFQFVVFL